MNKITVENKKMFIAGLAIWLIGLVFISMWMTLVPPADQFQGWVFITEGAVVAVAVNLLYFSVKKTSLIKKIYAFVVLLVIGNMGIGIALSFGLL